MQQQQPENQTKKVKLNIVKKTRKDVLKKIIQIIHDNPDIVMKDESGSGSGSGSGSEDKNTLSFTIYKNIMENDGTANKSTQGFLYETLWELMILTKSIPGIDYERFLYGQLQNLRPITNIRSILDKPLRDGNNPSDITIQCGTTITAFSVKNRFEEKYGIDQSDLIRIDADLKNYPDYNLGFIVKNKKTIQDYIKKVRNDDGKEVLLLKKVIENGLLFDESDLLIGIALFVQKFAHIKTLDEFIDVVNADYLKNARKCLMLKLHQKMAVSKFINNIKHKYHILDYKMRSGKTIVLLEIAKYLLQTGAKKILIMTPVRDTIQSFISDINSYVGYQIPYIEQTDFMKIPEDFSGIVFTSVQYLKMDNTEKKKEIIKRLNADAIFIDEAHIGSTTQLTKTEILDVTTKLIHSSMKHVMFASGTPDKIKKHYPVHPSCIYKWNIFDELHMKRGGTTEMEYMAKKHGHIFTESLKDTTLNKDYSNCPAQVLIKHQMDSIFAEQINKYNTENQTNYGFSCSSLMSLKKDKYGNYLDEFEICTYSSGIEIMKKYLENIISNNPMNKQTIMSHIEQTQTEYSSRKSTVDDPRLFIIFLPTNTGNSNIAALQRTLMKFIQTHDLWRNYRVEASNSHENSGSYSEGYGDFIQSCMQRTKSEKKTGCILLLGKQGTTGITYDDCDVTISMDDGKNLDSYSQSLARAMTPTADKSKTIGINVDMNVQRTFSFLFKMVNEYKVQMYGDPINGNKTNAEILQYFFENQIFLFNPHEFNFSGVQKYNIEYYKKVANEMLSSEIDEDDILDMLVCENDVAFNKSVRMNNNYSKNHSANDDLYGENPDLPKGENKRISFDIESDIESAAEAESEAEKDKNPENVENPEKDEEEINRINKVQLFAKYVIPLLACIIHVDNLLVPSYKTLFHYDNQKYKSLILSVIGDKNIDLKNITYEYIVNIMNKVIDENQVVINCLNELYSNATPEKFREIIAKHFVPTEEEKQKNAELPTPVILVDQMISVVPSTFWENPKNTVFEPCCGKGNFVLGIFDRFYKGLEKEIPDVKERCRHIATHCLYYADILPKNIFFTSAILKAYIQSYTKVNSQDSSEFKFNSHVGNTLDLDVSSVWPHITHFNAVMGNPPYHGETKAKGNSIWPKFVELAITRFIVEKGYLLFVHPAIWRKPGHKMREFMFTRQIHYLSIHNKVEGSKMFGATTRYDWYLLENTAPYQLSTVHFEDKQTHRFIIDENLPMIPNFGWSVIQKVMAKCTNGGKSFPILKDGYGTMAKHVSQAKKEGYIHPLLDSISRTKGKRYRWSTKAHPNQLKKKVMFSNGEVIVPFYDDGELGPGPGAMYMLVENAEEGQKVIDYLNTDLIVFMIRATKWSNFETCRHLFWHIPDYRDLSSDTINNDVVNQFFELTEMEIAGLRK